MSHKLIPSSALPGFPQAQTLELCAVDGAPGLFALSSPEAPTLRWFVLETAVHLPHYTPWFSDDHLAAVGRPAENARLVLAVVNTAAQRPSANLFAPLLVNDDTGQCAQVLLESQDWPLRHDLSA